MHVQARRSLPLLAVVAAWTVSCPAASLALSLDRLTPAETETLHRVLQTLEPVIAAKKQDGTANQLTWEALYASLGAEQQAFLDAFRALRGEQLGATSHYFGEVPGVELSAVGSQSILKTGVSTPLDPQSLPTPVLDAYRRMIGAMEADVGRRLLVESGYRSPAYQLYLFLYYMPKHDYSIKETNRFVALPGHSEHGYPLRQAIDFIN